MTPRRRRWCIGIAIGFALYSLSGFLLLPWLVKSQLLKQLPALTHRQVAVRQVRANPWTLSLTVRGLALTEPGGQLFASWEEFYVNFQLSSLFRWAWTFDEIRLENPRAEIVLGPDGRFNFANLLESTNPPAAPPKAGSPSIPRVLIFDLIVTNGHVGFADLARRTPFRTDYKPINFDLRQFTTRPDRQTPYSFEASSDSGRSLAWEGTITAQPAASSGAFKIEGIRLPPHSPYVEDFTRAQLTDGNLSLAAGYHFSMGTNGLELGVSNLVATLANLHLKDPDTGESVLSARAYELRDGSFDWRGRRVHLGSMTVNEPAALVHRRADGSINLPSLILDRLTQVPPPAPGEPAPAPEPSGESPWILTLDAYRLEGGSVQIVDDTVSGPFRTLLKPVTVQIDHFTTGPDSDAALRAELKTEAAESVKLEASYSINPVRATGALSVAAVDLKKYQSYLRPFFRGRLTRGTVDLDLNFTHLRPDQRDEVTVTNATLRVSNLQIQSADGAETLLTVPAFAVENVSASLTDQVIQVGAVKSGGTQLAARREADGTLNLLQLLTATNPPPTATDSPSAPTSSPWTVRIGEIALSDYSVQLEDRFVTPPTRTTLDQMSVNLRGLSTVSNAPATTLLSLRINETAGLEVKGTVLPIPPGADLEFGLTNFDLRTLQPYLEPQVRIGISNGIFGIQGRVRYQAPGTGSPELRFTGGFHVTNLFSTDLVAREPLVSWDGLDVSGIDFAWEPSRLQIGRLYWGGLKANLLIATNGQANLATLIPAPTNAPAAGPGTASSTPAAPFPIQLDELAIDHASFRFADASIQPNCRFEIQELTGTVRGLSSEAGATARVDLAGKVDDQSPFGLAGTFNPLAEPIVLNLSFTNQNLQLSPFSPYAEKYAGHPLNRGRLSLDLKYELQQTELKAENRFLIDQLTLGPRNESPEATSLPVKLGVALLKDRNGRIDLDVPVSGRLDDPEFKVGPIIVKVVANLIVKAAASPFKLLGGLVGGGEELSFVEFEPGQARFAEGETNKLGQLTRALLERPAINLELEASIDPRHDREAMARHRVRTRLQTERLAELAAAGQTPPATHTFETEPGEYERLLRAALIEKYGTNLTETIRAFAASATNQITATNTAGATRPDGSASRASPRGGLLQRATGWLPFQKKDSPAAEARTRARADAALLKENPELAATKTDLLEALLASKTEVPAEEFERLMQERARAVQDALLQGGEIAAERLFLIPPKAVDDTFRGEARVNLSLN
ncbi:MAG: DUF748 domain-containing protein [Limisphaerales bacterium]